MVVLRKDLAEARRRLESGGAEALEESPALVGEDTRLEQQDVGYGETGRGHPVGLSLARPN